LTDKEQLMRLLFETIDELNEQLPPKKRLEKSTETVLFGDSSKLESLGLINLIVITERKVTEEFGMTITLADEKTLSQIQTIFKTPETLVNHIFLLLNE
jgi:acyl carrier protein